MPASLRTLDLNLLRVFDMLMQERHVSRAADRLGLTQSSTSNALDRLRRALDDRVLERQGQAMVPTRAALDLWPRVQDALRAVEIGLEELRRFDPTTHRETFTIGIDDYSLQVWGRAILAAVRSQAPGVRLAFTAATAQSDEAALLAGDIDLLVGPVWYAHPGLEMQQLASERFVGLVDAGHAMAQAGGDPDLGAYLSAPHLLVSQRGIVAGNVDQGLAALGRSRQIACAVPYVAQAAELLVGSDMVLNIGQRLGARMAARHGLHMFDLPLDVPGYDVAMLWTRRNSSGPAHRWLRGVVAGVLDTQDP